MESNIKNLLRLFLDAIRDYEHENGDRITDDERESEEFVKIFLESEDAFDYKIILSEINRLKEEANEVDHADYCMCRYCNPEFHELKKSQNKH